MIKKFKNPDNPHFLLLIVITGAIFLKLVGIFLFQQMIENAYHGNSFNYLNHLLEQHRLKNPIERDLQFYQNEVSTYTNRLIILAALCSSCIWLICRENFQRIRSFLYEKGSSVNLAVLRISLVAYILYTNFPTIAAQTVELGRDALVAPPGWSTVLNLVPVNTDFVTAVGILFWISGLSALLGFFTRTSLGIMAILGFYLMGIPQFFGKIDHYHILWHVLLLLPFTPCGDALSIDSLRKKDTQQKISVQYGFSLKIVMILIGISYFFPGVWKFVFSGFEWAFSENLKFKMHSKWLEFGGWVPLFRIDHYSFLYQGAAFMTLIVELGFIFALFFKKIRPFFVIGGFLFHLSVLYFMGISFYALMILYVVFIDWAELWNKLKQTQPIKDGLHSSSYLKNHLSRSLKVISILLIVGNVVAGGLLINSWPFSVNPTFASIETETVPTLLIELQDEQIDETKTVIPLLDENFQRAFESTGRLRGFLDSIVRSQEPDRANLNTLKTILEKHQYIIHSQYEIKFYQIRMNTNPDLEEPEFKKTRLLGVI